MHRINYISNSRIPTQKAHGRTVVDTCIEFSKQSNRVRLIIPFRFNNIKESIFTYYGIENIFYIVKLPSLDVFFIEPLIGKFAFWVQYLSFYISVYFYFIFFVSRKEIIYTRDLASVFLVFFGFKVFCELHIVSNKKNIFFKIANKFTKIIVISEGIKKQLCNDGNIEKDKILVSPSYVRSELFNINISKLDARKKLKLPENGSIILYTGSFKTMGVDKGISDILKSVSMLKSIVFVAVGGSSEDIKEYSKQANLLGVNKNVIFRDRVNQKNLALYQKASDILLMPFPYNEHYANNMSPMKMFEYMVSKRPIIASKLPSITEVLNDTNSILCAPDNPEDLSDKINLLLYNESLGKRISEQAFEDVKAYSLYNRIRNILCFIKTV